MLQKKFFLFGFGQVAKYFIKKVISHNQHIKFHTTSRKETSSKSYLGINYTSYEFNEKKFDKDIGEKIKEADYILISIPPINGNDLVVKFFEKYFKDIDCKWVTYLSATSVYGDHQGNWVNEHSSTKPTTSSGLARLEAEKKWIELSNSKKFPLQIFRLAGIYSNEFNILKRIQQGEIKVVDKEDHFFSRIHVEDIANILFLSLENFKKDEVYNVCDDRPASQKEVATYASKLLKVPKLNFINVNEIENIMLRNFYKDSKRVDNKKLKSFFNYKMKYPSYVEGLNYIFDNNF